MKRIFCLILVFVAVFAVSCSGKKKAHEENGYVEKVSKEISADEGGTVESSDGKTSVEIPAGALDGDTTISMTVYDAEGYAGTEELDVISRIVEFEPSGIIFKKPVIISMPSLKDTGNRIITAAVFHETEEKWSYSETGAAVKIAGRTESGDPIMTSASGDPIMLNASGDPIMTSASGDPIMLSASGDPIMVTASGDPIMNSASGDPIMMTTGHFTAYTFIALEPAEAVEPDNEPADDTDTAETNDDKPVDDGDTDTAETDDDEPIDDTDTCDEDITDDDTTVIDDNDEIEDIDELDDTEPADNDVVPEPEPVYSNVICTNMAICTNGNKSQVYCPKSGEPFYGQDAQYAARKGCVAHHGYTEIPNTEGEEAPFVKDNVTGLTWWFTGVGGTFESMKNNCDVSYGGIDDWRLPTQKELLTLSDLGRIHGAMIDPVYFSIIYKEYEVNKQFAYTLSDGGNYIYVAALGMMLNKNAFGGEAPEGFLICVSGEKYGETNPENYTDNGDGTVFDSVTNLFWQKNTVVKDTWEKALSYCENLEFAGHSDWRLPNRNELASLVDYSKAETGAEVISSFPDMSPDMFWTSTPGNVEGDSWIVDMKSGNVSQMNMDEMDDSPTFSVRCVRSDLVAKPEIPDCDETGIAPCRDTNGTIWSQVIYPEIFADFNQSVLRKDECLDPEEEYCEAETIIGWLALAEMCRYLNENDSNNWRLPNINEIRGIITSEKLKKGGACALTDECYQVSYISGEVEEDKCTTDDASQTALYDFGLIVSNSWQSEDDYHGLWGFRLNAGGIKYPTYEFNVSGLVQRCVLDESMNYKKTPYYDSDRRLFWSDISSDELDLYDGDNYCNELSEEDPEHYWRQPTLAELRTVTRNCEEYSCETDVTGKYSVFGDIATLWTADGIGGENENYRYIVFNFSNSAEEEFYFDSDTAKVRCVSTELECGPADETPCTDSSSALMWSAMAPDQLDIDAAVAHCENLTEGGYDDWRLPDIDELRTLIEGCDGTVTYGSCRISDPDYLSSDYWDEDDCACEAGDSGYSKFGTAGDVILWSSSVRSDHPDFNWYVDFNFGTVDSSLNSGGLDVRCVR